MTWYVVLFYLACALVSAADDRDARWFNRQTKTVTKVVKEKFIVTEVTPSSCVVVQTSLPPCRHLRAIPIQPTQVYSIVPTEAPSMRQSAMEQQGWQPVNQPTDPLPLQPVVKVRQATQQPPQSQAAPTTPSSGWNWDIFNFRQPEVTVTQTIKDFSTSRYIDPNTVVTFSVKGCRPSRLPFDLPECRVAPPLKEQNRNIIVMAPVKFVPNIDQQLISPSETQDDSDVTEIVEKDTK